MCLSEEVLSRRAAESVICSNVWKSLDQRSLVVLLLTIVHFWKQTCDITLFCSFLFFSRHRVELSSCTFTGSTVYQWVAEVHGPLGLSKQAVFKVRASALPRPVVWQKERFLWIRNTCGVMWQDCHLQIADSVAEFNWFLQARGQDHNCGELWDKMVQCDSATN